jgi:hypothetical protein
MNELSVIRCQKHYLHENKNRLRNSRFLLHGAFPEFVPNLGKGAAFFYDPATKKLNPAYSGYTDILQSIAEFIHKVEEAYGALLNQIQAERQQQAYSAQHSSPSMPG